MKVLFINSVVDYGSTGKIVRSLSDSLKEQGHETLIIYGRNASTNTTDTLCIEDKMGQANHLLRSRWLGEHGLHSTKATQIAIKAIEEFNPDVIHLHNLHGYYLNVPMLLDYLKDSSTKVFWTLHDAWLISGSSAYFDYHGCKTWDDGCVECNNTSDYPEVKGTINQIKNFNWKREKLTQLHNVTFITPSQWLNELVSETFLSKFPIITVPNGIDIESFKPRYNAKLTETYKDKKILLGVANKWERRKGLDDFIKLNDLLDDSYQIILIGLDKKQISELPSSIIGLEKTSSVQELAEYYTLAHAFINPTYEDNYPTTNLESICCHTPVVAYDTGGNKEVDISPIMNIVPKGDIEGLAKKIQNLNTKISDNYNTTKHSNETFLENMLKLY